jgi:hypothetical protein
LRKINGGEPFWAKRWATDAGRNTGFWQGIAGHYDFVPKYAS